MAKKSMSYDHPAYLTRFMLGGTLTGSAGVTPKFAAFAAMKIKAVQIGHQTAGTSGDQPLLYAVSGTTTTTDTLTAITSAAIAASNNVINRTLAAGDVFWVVKGTDATAVYAAGIECELVPGADVTA